MQQKMQRLVRSGRAQGMVEYILIVALIALVAIAGVRMFGDKLFILFKSKADKMENEIGGD